LTQEVRHAKGSDRTLTEKLENLEEGDKILFSGRKQPLTVTSITLQEFERGEVYMGGLEGPQGADYTFIQSVKNPNIVTVNSMAISVDGEVIRDIEVVEG